MNAVRVRVGKQSFLYADPEKAFAAAANLRKLADHYQGKMEENRTVAAMLDEQAALLAARRKAMAEATAAKKRAAV